MPILLYGNEVIGHDKHYALEKVHLKFCKMIIHRPINKKKKKKMPMWMVLGLGRFPIEVYTKSRIINFWSRLVYCGRTCSIMYQLLL